MFQLCLRFCVWADVSARPRCRQVIFSARLPPQAVRGDPRRATARRGGRSVQRSLSGSHAAPAASTRCERQRTQAGVQPARAHPTPVGLPSAVQAGGASSGTKPRGGVQPPPGRRKEGPDREGSNNRDRGEDAGMVVAVGPAATGPKRRAYSATRKKRIAGGVDGALHLPCAKHWGMRCGVVDPDEVSPAAGGNPSRDHSPTR